MGGATGAGTERETSESGVECVARSAAPDPRHLAADAITKPSCQLRSGRVVRVTLRALQQYTRNILPDVRGRRVKDKGSEKSKSVVMWRHGTGTGYRVLKLPPQDAEPPLGCVCSAKVRLDRRTGQASDFDSVALPSCPS